MEIHLTQAISELDLAEAIIEEMEHPILQRKPVNNHGTTQPVLGTTWSGKVFKPQTIKQCTLANRYPGRGNEQLQEIRNSFRKVGWILLAVTKGWVELTSTIESVKDEELREITPET